MFGWMNETATSEMPPMRAVEDQLSMPMDLSLWVPVAQLRDWIMSDVATLDWTNAEMLEILRQRPEFEPKALVNTMTLGYATGVFAAEEIARHCSENPQFRNVRPKLPPIASDLKKFRKENRGVLKWCLTSIITRAVKTQFIEGGEIDILPAGLRRYVVENAIERLDIARHMDRSGEL